MCINIDMSEQTGIHWAKTYPSNRPRKRFENSAVEHLHKTSRLGLFYVLGICYLFILLKETDLGSNVRELDIIIMIAIIIIIAVISE